MIDQLEFLKLHLLDGMSYPDIASRYGIERAQLSAWWENEEGQRIREQIKRSNTLFNNRKDNESFVYFSEKGKRAFYEWLSPQLELDECAYCGTKGEVLRSLFDKDGGVLSSKRKGGAGLELERRDAKGNLYTEENCVLVCYVCNNHKSDVISEADHRKYFAPIIHQYLMDKYNEQQQNTPNV